MSTSLEQLSQYTTLVADTGDLKAIARLKPVDATTNPSLVTTALLSGEHDALIHQVKALKLNADASIDRLSAELGKQILTHITGRVSTEVDARHAYDTEATIENALQFMTLYDHLGVDCSRVLIKIAATWQGIKAAEILEKQGIHCNLTLIFTQAQAIACADAGVTLISPFVGRISDWQKTFEQKTHLEIKDDLGVDSVRKIYYYYKCHGYDTQVMGASFRSVEQIMALAGCDLLTITPVLLDALSLMDDAVPRILSPEIKQIPNPKTLSETDFYQAMATQAVATLLPKGIDAFINARTQLQHQLFV